MKDEKGQEQEPCFITIIIILFLSFVHRFYKKYFPSWWFLDADGYFKNYIIILEKRLVTDTRLSRDKLTYKKTYLCELPILMEFGINVI